MSAIRPGAAYDKADSPGCGLGVIKTVILFTVRYGQPRTFPSFAINKQIFTVEEEINITDDATLDDSTELLKHTDRDRKELVDSAMILARFRDRLREH